MTGNCSVTILFDLDDTLVVEEASAEAAFRATCRLAHEQTGVDPETMYTSIRESCRTFWRNSPARPYCLSVGISSWEGLWAQFHGDDDNLRILSEWAPTYRSDSWREALHRCGCERDDAIVEELSETYVRERRMRHIVYDDVLPVLTYCRQKHRLGLLTNGTPDLQRAKLEGSGLGSFFDSVVVSGEVGFGKPDVRIFELALERLGGSAASTIMIGNSLQTDVEPAMKVGMTGVWVNRERKARDASVVPDFEVMSLVELEAIL